MGFACCVWGLMRKMVGPRGAGKEGWSGAGESWMAASTGPSRKPAAQGCRRTVGWEGLYDSQVLSWL